MKERAYIPKETGWRGYGVKERAYIPKEIGWRGYGKGKESSILKESQCERVWRKEHKIKAEPPYSDSA